MSQQRFQQETYDGSFRTIAPSWVAENLADFSARHILRLLPGLPPIGHALEVGCGEGGVLSRMAAALPGWHIEGVDISERRIEVARARGLDVSVRDVTSTADLANYDLVYGTAILHHLPDLPQFFTAVSRQVRPSGRIVFGAEPHRFGWHYQLYHRLRGDWALERGQLHIHERGIRQALAPHFHDIRFHARGNVFAYATRTGGRLMEVTGLGRIPILNDLWVTAVKH